LRSLAKTTFTKKTADFTGSLDKRYHLKYKKAQCYKHCAFSLFSIM